MSGVIAQNSGRHTGLVKAASAAGTWNLIETITASSDSTIEFDSNIDSTYDEYQVHFIDVHPGTDNYDFQVNFRDGSTAYDATKTTTFFQASQDESAGSVGIEYRTANDLAQATGFQDLMREVANENDTSICGILKLFGPSSTTFVKHFMIRTQGSQNGAPNAALDCFASGYCNTTSAIDGIQFQFESGNIDAGTFSLYGIT
tara:strand:+ start:146 stop:751 length:606 start_codon:yes stop_codon:yes gene_type:complete